MTIKTATALETETTSNVTQNTTRSNTGTNVQTLFLNLIDSLWGSEYVVAIDNTDSPYTVNLDNTSVIIADDSSGAITINLPAIASNQHRVLTVKKIGASNSVTLDGNSTETIDGATTKALSTQYNFVKIVGGASEWHIIGE